MTTIKRLYDPSITERKFLFAVREDHCPGLIAFLTGVDYGSERTLVRAVFYQWFLEHRTAGTLENAVGNALCGPGGRVHRRTGHDSPNEVQRNVVHRPLPEILPRPPAVVRHSVEVSVGDGQLPEKLASGNQAINVEPLVRPVGAVPKILPDEMNEFIYLSQNIWNV